MLVSRQYVYYRQCDIHHNEFPPFAESICLYFAVLFQKRFLPPDFTAALASHWCAPVMAALPLGWYLFWTVIQLSGRREDFLLSVHKVFVLCSRIWAFTKSLQMGHPLCCIWVKSHIHPLQHTSLQTRPTHHQVCVHRLVLLLIQD